MHWMRQNLMHKQTVSLALYKQRLENEFEDFQWRLHTYPVNQMYSLHGSVPTLLMNQHRIDSVEDAEAYLTRLNGLPAYFDQIITALKLRADNGVITPKFVFAHVIRTGNNINKGAPISEGKDNTVFADFKKKVEKLYAEDTSAEATVKKADLIARAEKSHG